MCDWMSINKEKPPFDTLVIVRGNDEYGGTVYSLAYNECFPPEMGMTLITGMDYREEKEYRLPVYKAVPFEIEYWKDFE
jgi:hypothetical protein